MPTIVVYLILLTLITPPLGAFMYRVYTSQRIGRVEGVIYRLIGVDPLAEQTWRRYASSVLWFSAVSMLFTYFVMRFQGHLPLNPVGLAAPTQYVSFNTATSFVTNTNWQAYGGESTMSYLTQMIALTFQNFLSAAVGMAVLIAMIRGFTRHKTDGLGNFWRDTVRGVVYILLPISIVVAIILMSQGVVQTFANSATLTGVQGSAQTIARGPVASQIAIKQLGTNGGGFFNVNSAHTFEGGKALANFLELLLILGIPAALTYTFGKMVGRIREGWAIFAAMMIIFVSLLAVCVVAEQNGHLFVKQGVDHVASALQAGGNMEGKEFRFGIANSALWATATTSASNGSVNSMHDSYA